MGRKTLLVLALWGAAFASTPATQSAFSLDSKPARRNATARVAFEPNQGQTDPQVRFLARDRNSVLFLTEQAALLKLRTRVKAGVQAHGNHSGGTVLRFSWIGANGAPILYPQERLAGEVNYFRGMNSSRGKPAVTRLPTFARVTYRTLYPGVDLSFHSKRGFLEFDFIVAPHGNLSQIGYSIEGADSIRLDANGDLVLMADGGEIRKHKPIAYQSINSKRRSVPAKYVVHGARIGFAVGAYDTTRPLVIDPAISYSTYIGGSDGDDARAITVDSSGRAYIAGRTISADFPTKNAFQPTRNSLQESCGSDATSFQQEAFVTKLWATGGGLIYSTYLGGENDDTALGIAVDSSGHAYVTGQTCSREFPITPGAAQTALHGTTDAFIAKLSASGSALLYSTYLGGVYSE